MTPPFAIRDLTVERGGNAVVRQATAAVEAGEVVGLIGPNGAGKTTLLRAALGLIPASGDRPLARLEPRARARRVAWLPQAREIAWGVSVSDLVALGVRAADPSTADPRPQARAALERLGIAALADRPADRLSGGEAALVLLARALAQDTPVLMADEPVAGLDPAHQIAVMTLFRELAEDGRAVLLSIHDLGLAARGCDRLVALHRGRVVADGPPESVLTPEFLGRVFGISGLIERRAEGLIFQPLARVAGEWKEAST